MNERKRAFLRLVPVFVLFAALCVSAWLHKPQDTSLSERRPLAQFPGLTADSLLEGDFMTDFEDYATDQFPLRESFRKLQSFIQFNLLGQKDVNDIYIAEGSAAKLEDALNEKWVQNSVAKLEAVFNTHFNEGGSKAYFALIPDKGWYLAEKHGYPAMDHEKLLELVENAAGFAQWIPLKDTLDITDYYTTDSHWRQECIGDTAQALGNAMGVDISQKYVENVAREDFSGVYAGQSAMKVSPDTIKYLTNDILNNVSVTSFDTGRPETSYVYNFEKANGRDPYELFLSGNNALLVVENPSAKEKRELVIFRDSYASSLAPILVPAYSKITLVDIRYIQSAMIGSFVDFQNSDVLFLYSSSLLNSSLAMK